MHMTVEAFDLEIIKLAVLRYYHKKRNVIWYGIHLDGEWVFFLYSVSKVATICEYIIVNIKI